MMTLIISTVLDLGSDKKESQERNVISLKKKKSPDRSMDCFNAILKFSTVRNDLSSLSDLIKSVIVIMVF
jgi:hypothetical protein